MGKKNILFSSLSILFASASYYLHGFLSLINISVFCFTLFFGIKYLSFLFCGLKKNISLPISLWIVKLFITAFLQTYGGWVGIFHHDYSGPTGYDAYRFYYDAQAMVENDWIPPILSNYQGILYYYGIIFFLLDWNPIIPGLINCLVSLFMVGSVFIFLYRLIPQNIVYLNQIFYLLLIPEALSWDVQTSRETLMPAIITICILSMALLFNNLGRNKIFTILIILASFIITAITRTTMLLPLFIICFFIQISIKSFSRLFFLGLPFLCVIIFILFYSQKINSILNAQSGEEGFTMNILTGGGTKNDGDWMPNSFGAQLQTNSILLILPFSLIRAIIYLAAPLPYVTFDPIHLFFSNRHAWHEFLTILSSLIYILSFPFFLIGFRYYLFKKSKSEKIIFQGIYLSGATLLFSVAIGNQIIHERYRLMAMPLILTGVFLGYHLRELKSKKYYIFIWYFFCLLSGLSFFIYKLGSS